MSTVLTEATNKSVTKPENCTLGEIRNERIKLEAFLFNESNKITRPSIKYTLQTPIYIYKQTTRTNIGKLKIKNK